MNALLEIRRRNGTLEFDRPETEVIFDGETITSLHPALHTRSSRLIENAMIAANNAMSHFLASRGYSIVQRVLPKSERWEEIVDLAREQHFTLSHTPDSQALRAFLSALRTKYAADIPLFQDQCLNIIKLLGRGEYVAFVPGSEPQGHFALAVADYAHSTAPNRRYPDVIVHRILKAALKEQPSPYDDLALASLAAHCTEQEGQASRLERRLHKSAACILLRNAVGQQTDAVVTGASDKGAYARFVLNNVPAEGMIVHVSRKYRVGDKLRAELKRVDIENGYIDIEDVAAAAQQAALEREKERMKELGLTGKNGKKKKGYREYRRRHQELEEMERREEEDEEEEEEDEGEEEEDEEEGEDESPPQKE